MADQPPENSGSELLGVRLKAGDGDLAKLEAAAAEAGWTEHRRDIQGTTLLLAPSGYKPADFGRLLDAISGTKITKLGLQLIGQDGRAIGPDGRPIEEK